VPESTDTDGLHIGYIYALAPPKPAKQHVHYVGRSSHPPIRTVKTFVAKAKHGDEGFLYDWLRSLGDDNPTVTILDEVPVDQLDAYRRAWIYELLHRGAPLIEGHKWAGRRTRKPTPAILENVRRTIRTIQSRAT
jgi:hypothetical protein